MGILDKVTKLEKRIEKLAVRGDVPLEPAEVRRAVLDDVEELIQPGPRSKAVFPYNRLEVSVVAPDAARRAAFEAALDGEAGLKAAIEERLREAGCTRMPAMRVTLRYVRKAGADWDTGRVFRTTAAQEDAPPERSASEPAAPAQIVVVKGSATRKAYALTAERTNVGRTAEVVDKERRVARRNQVVFAEAGDAVNDTVSRAQAHILRTPAGEYRLFDDHSSHGTRIFRDGRTIALPSGSPRGVRLQSGDEIYFGQACVRFEVK
jgi:hypothetical protein